MKEELLEPKLYSQAPPVCLKPGCGGEVFIPHEDGWQCFNCMKIIYKADERGKKNVVVIRYDRNKQEGDLRLKNLVKRILSPGYRRSCQIVRYIDKGYSHQEALAKVGAIEI